ncbi:MAG: SH3 domain-containing protein [PVC group bacterium]|nr:SH3 domain-containing protein [PVC group bacterium]
MRKIIDCLWRVFIVLGFFCMLIEPCAAQQSKDSTYTGIITADAVNIRSGPSLNFEIITKLDKDALVLIQETQGEWHKIKLPPTSAAYMHRKFLRLAGKQAIVKGNRVNVRAGKGTQFNVLGQLNDRDLVALIAREKEWYKIFPSNNCFAWIHKNFVVNFGKSELYLAEERKYRSKIIKIKQKAKQTPLAKQPAPATKKSPKINYSKTAPIAQGKLMEMGRFFKRHGTHKLLIDKKPAYLLKSETIDLDDYIYYKVDVWGTQTTSAKSKLPIINVEHIKKLN